MNAKEKTQMEEVEAVGITEQEFLNARDIAEERNRARREIRKQLNIVVKHNTPIEQVCMSAKLLTLIDDVFATTKAQKIMARLGNCEAVEIENVSNVSVAQGIFSLYKSAKKAQQNGTLGEGVFELSEKGVKMEKYAFSFYVMQ